MTAVIICPNCEAKVRARHHRCPRCRFKFNQATEPRFDFSRVAPFAVAVLLLAAAVAGYALWRQSGEPSIEPVPPKAAEVVPRTPRPSARVSRPREETPVPFVEAGRAGNAAYGAGDYPGALAAYKEAVAKNPADAESWSNMGQIMVRLGQVSEAVPAFNRAIQLNPDRWAYHFNLARASGLLGLWDQAVSEYRQAQRLLPGDYAVTFNLGLALKKAGDLAGAAEELEKAAELNPEDASFRLALARTYEDLGRKQEAVAAYQQTLVLAPDATEAPIIRARIDALLK